MPHVGLPLASVPLTIYLGNGSRQGTVVSLSCPTAPAVAQAMPALLPAGILAEPFPVSLRTHMKPASKTREQGCQSSGTHPRRTAPAPATARSWHRPMEDQGEGEVISQVALGISLPAPFLFYGSSDGPRLLNERCSGILGRPNATQPLPTFPFRTECAPICPQCCPCSVPLGTTVLNVGEAESG